MRRFARKPFAVVTEIDDGSISLVLEGELDIATTPLFVQHIERAERAQPELLLFDLGALSFIDVSGLSAMLAAARRARGAGRRVMVSAASPPVRRLFELTALDRSFELPLPSA